MRVREKDGVEMADAVVGEQRQKARVGRTAIDEDRVLAVPDGERIALADVEGDQLRCRRVALRDRGDGRNRNRDRHRNRASFQKREREQCGAEADDHRCERRCGVDAGDVCAEVVDRAARGVERAEDRHQLRARNDAGGDRDGEHR